jgi:hypothetical protein
MSQRLAAASAAMPAAHDFAKNSLEIANDTLAQPKKESNYAVSGYLPQVL